MRWWQCEACRGQGVDDEWGLCQDCGQTGIDVQPSRTPHEDIDLFIAALSWLARSGTTYREVARECVTRLMEVRDADMVDTYSEGGDR